MPRASDMKLVHCPDCMDVFAVRMNAWRTCECGKVGGQYNADAMTATIGGKTARVFGVANPFFDAEFESWSPQKRGSVHRQWGYGPNEIWWGGHAGDWQLIRIDSPKGPRRSHPAVLKEITRILRGQKKTQAEIRKVIAQVNEYRKSYQLAKRRKKSWEKFRTKK